MSFRGVAMVKFRVGLLTRLTPGGQKLGPFNFNRPSFQVKQACSTCSLCQIVERKKRFSAMYRDVGKSDRFVLYEHLCMIQRFQPLIRAL
jgi:hypothetical protein